MHVPPWAFLLSGVLSVLGFFGLYANDPDMFSMKDLLSWMPHHELWEMVSVVLAAASFTLYTLKSEKSNP